MLEIYGGNESVAYFGNKCTKNGGHCLETHHQTQNKNKGGREKKVNKTETANLQCTSRTKVSLWSGSRTNRLSRQRVWEGSVFGTSRLSFPALSNRRSRKTANYSKAARKGTNNVSANSACLRRSLCGFDRDIEAA